MKKVFSLMLLLATMLTFTACSGDNDDEPDYPSIVGTWFRTYSSTSGNYTITVEQTSTFHADNTVVAHMKMYMNDNLLRDRQFNYTYSYNGKILTMTEVDSGETQKYSVKILGNTLTLIGDNGESVFTKK